MAATALIVAAEASHTASHGVLPAARGNGVPRFWGTPFFASGTGLSIFAKLLFRAERGRAGLKSALPKPSQGPGA